MTISCTQLLASQIRNITEVISETGDHYPMAKNLRTRTMTPGIEQLRTEHEQARRAGGRQLHAA